MSLMMQVLCVILLALTSQCFADVPADEVTDLPGLTFKPSFRHYSGFLNATGTRKLHYWLTLSQNNPKTDPIVLWMNGGPGCSSLLGLLTEHGPFQVDATGQKINQNNYSWNQIANVIYLEAPAGVGFSYSSDKNYTTSDDQTALDNYYALKSFFTLFPEYKTNDFYITGESYGGIYVPTLAVRVLSDSAFNFKGFAVGNGISDWTMNSNSLAYYVNHHALVDQSLWLSAVAACCKNGNSTYGNCDFTTGAASPDCADKASQLNGATDGLNPYNIYQDCYQGQGNTLFKKVRTLPALRDFNPKLFRSNMPSQALPSQIPCEDTNAAETYLNIPAVRTALHIPSNVQAWSSCSSLDYEIQYQTVNKEYMQVLQSQKQRIMVYNGDFDSMCNYLGDEWFVDSLKQPVMTEWSPWFITDGSSQQVAGFVKKYKQITFVTVKGAGHMVPTDKPMSAFVMFKNFLSGTF